MDFQSLKKIFLLRFPADSLGDDLVIGVRGLLAEHARDGCVDNSWICSDTGGETGGVGGGELGRG